MNRTLLTPLAAAFLLLTACATPEKTMPQSRPYTLVLIKTGPMSGKLSKEENDKAFEGHFANMARLAEEHKLVLAGPYGKARHEPDLRGLFVINSGQRSEAVAWASTDPTVKAGVFVLDFHDFSTDAPLPALLERNLELKRKDAAEGRTRKPGEDARGYVILIAENQDLARRELAPMEKDGSVLLLARLDGSRVFAILDAKDIADAQARYSAALGRVGEHTLDDWFATNQLAHLQEL
ncbi:MAG: YciI family protein [Planctomycetes bacterium]|nr:YciI family protein [Planctomycetota bacterium]